MSRNNNGTDLFLAFVAGAAVGATLGILYAPDKGKNTRDKLSFQLEKYKEKLQQLINDMLDGNNEPTSEARIRQEQITNDTIKQAEKIMSDINALQKTIHVKKD
jgi:gas vesicle protein